MASSSATIVIGFEVHHSDFWEQKTWMDDFVSCANGHKGGERGKFCSDCGTKCGFQTHQKWAPTPNFLVYCSAKGVQPEETWDPNPKGYFGDRADDNGFDGLLLLCADATQDSESTRDLFVLGCESLKVKDICRGEDDHVLSLDWDGLTNAFAQCSELARILGLHNRPVKLYLTGLCSF